MMDAFPIVCDLAKAITRSSRRQGVSQVLWDLDHAVPGGSQSGMFGYLTRRGRFHFCEYLHLNANIETVRARLPGNDLSGLTDDQWRILGEADKFIREINARVLRSTVSAGSALAEASDPYGLVADSKYHPSTPEPVQLLRDCEAELGKLEEVVRNHPALKRLETVESATSSPSVPQRLALAAEVERLSAEVVRMSRGPDIFRVEQLRGMSPGTPGPVARRLRLIADLFCLRQLLITIDQVVFTAFKLDKLVALTEDIVFSASSGSDSLGGHATLSFQPNGPEQFIQPRDIVMLAPPDMEMPPFRRGPAEVHSVVDSFSRETGNSVTLEVRMMDAWLNPFSGMAAG